MPIQENNFTIILSEFSNEEFHLTGESKGNGNPLVNSTISSLVLFSNTTRQTFSLLSWNFSAKIDLLVKIIIDITETSWIKASSFDAYQTLSNTIEKEEDFSFNHVIIEQD